MPEISRFFGITVRMYHDDHGPPHFHAVYAGHKIKVDIHTGSTRGHFPPRALRLLMEWYHLHRAELAEDWALAAADRPLKRIEPLE